ncbi:Protein yhjK [Klebsiella pneumoniae IS46]|nr:Protein yhjK [Klebsiella pneumoniae IS46]
MQAAGVEVLQGHLFGCALPQEAFSARYLSPAREDANL